MDEISRDSSELWMNLYDNLVSIFIISEEEMYDNSSQVQACFKFFKKTLSKTNFPFWSKIVTNNFEKHRKLFFSKMYRPIAINQYDQFVNPTELAHGYSSVSE
jgi:hypothetical protein